MLKTIVIDNFLFAEGDAVDRADCETLILWLLEVVVLRNMNYLRRHPECPKLYDSGVVYALPDQMREGRLSPGKLAAARKFLKGLGVDESTLDILLAILEGTEIFRDIPAILQKKAVDCFPLSQKIIARSKSTGMYELVAIGDLRHVYPAYEALSYNFLKCAYEFWDIVGFVDKGVKPVSRARLSNGTDLVSTNSHEFWSVEGSGVNARRIGKRTMGEYVETYAEYHAGRMSRGMRGVRSRILQAAKIPALSVVKASSAEAYLAGIYAAEGYTRIDGRPTIAQHRADVCEKIEHALAEVGIRHHYTPGHGKTPGSGAEYQLYGSAMLMDAFRAMGRNSFDKRLPKQFLSGDEATVAMALKGHADGDAWQPAKGSYKRPNIDAIYATSSDVLMEQLRLGDLILGRPTYAYRYEDHQGAGDKPIWRLHEYNKKADKLNDRARMVEEDLALPGLRYGTVRNAVPAGKAHVGCIEVDSNHNFFLADGTLVSNCDNLCCWRAAELRVAGVKAAPYITWREVPDGTTYHALVRWPDGTSEDPSRILGMYADAQPDLRREEFRKNHERFDDYVRAGRALVQAGRASPEGVVEDVRALGLLPQDGSW